MDFLTRCLFRQDFNENQGRSLLTSPDFHVQLYAICNYKIKIAIKNQIRYKITGRWDFVYEYKIKVTLHF